MQDINNLLAKGKNDQEVSLIEHSIAVCDKVIELCKAGNIHKDVEPLCVIAGLFHDIGKCTHDFQNWLHDTSGEVQQKLRHNIVSARMFMDLVRIKYSDDYASNEDEKDIIQRVILHHHPIEKCYDEATIPFSTGLSNEFYQDDIDTMLALTQHLVDYYNKIAIEHNYPLTLVMQMNTRSRDFSAEYYQSSDDITSMNPIMTSMNGVVRFADGLVSGNIKNHSDYIDFSFDGNTPINKPQEYDGDRFQKQMDTAMELDHRFSILHAPVGYGKTLIGLRWMLSDTKKCIWVCPDNATAEAAYHGITRELRCLGLSDKISKVGLLLTNEFREGDKDGCKNDIIVTNIDNYTRPIFKSDNKRHMIFNLSYCNVIFDEYHKYACSGENDCALLAVFKTAIRSRMLFGNTNTLLMSATKNEMLYDDIISNYPECVKEVDVDDESYTNKMYTFSVLKNTNNLSGTDCLIARNSVKYCQESFKGLADSTTDVCVNGKLTDNDCDEHLEKIMQKHRKGCDKQQLVVSTNLITTGVDVSFNKCIMTPMPLAEIIQTCGRVNRYNEYDNGGIIEFDEVAKDTKNERFAIQAKYDEQLFNIEYKFLVKKLKEKKGEDGKIRVSLKDLNNIRMELMGDSDYKKTYEGVYKGWMKKSFEALAKLSYNYSPSTNDEKQVGRIAKKGSIRGNNAGDIFIHTVGMEDGEYVKETFVGNDYEILVNSVKYMMTAILNDDELRVKYYPNLKEAALKARMRKLNSDDGGYATRLCEEFVNMAKCSDTPFIITNKAYAYNHEYGLYATNK